MSDPKQVIQLLKEVFGQICSMIRTLNTLLEERFKCKMSIFLRMTF